MNILSRKADTKRAAYRRTVSEIRSMSPAVAMDLGIFPEDAEKLARKAVYGA